MGGRRRRRHGPSCGCGGGDVPAPTDVLVAVRGRRRPAARTGHRRLRPHDRPPRRPRPAERRASTRRRPTARRGSFSFVGRQRGQGHQRRAGRDVARRAGAGAEQHWDDDRARGPRRAGRGGTTVDRIRTCRRQPGEAVAVRDTAKRRGPTRAGSRPRDRWSLPAMRSPDPRSRAPTTRGWPRRRRS